jgi:hypothetical protein
MFEAERGLIERAIAPYLVGGIEHVGSTAIPNLPAKPVIDIMAGVRSLDASLAALPLLEPFGYCYFPYKPDVMHWFCKPSNDVRTHHLHLVPFRRIVNIGARTVEVYSSPEGDRYAEVRTLHTGETRKPAQLADVALAVAEILPKA